MAMIVTCEPSFTYSCDWCGKSVTGDSEAHPPEGFATLAVHPKGGVGQEHHLCVGPCLTVGADNIAKGLTVAGEPPSPFV